MCTRSLKIALSKNVDRKAKCAGETWRWRVTSADGVTGSVFPHLPPNFPEERQMCTRSQIQTRWNQEGDWGKANFYSLPDVWNNNEDDSFFLPVSSTAFKFLLSINYLWEVLYWEYNLLVHWQRKTKKQNDCSPLHCYPATLSKRLWRKIQVCLTYELI